MNQSLYNLTELVTHVNNATNATHPDQAKATPWVPSTADYTMDQINAMNYVTWVCYPILLACCTVGNVMNFIVLIHEPHKGSTNAYMMTVAICDLFVLWLFMPIYLYNISSPLRHKSPLFITAFFNFYGMQQWGQETSIQLCDWILIVFSLERLLAVIRPFSFRVMHTARNARVVSLILFVLAGMFTLYNPVQFYTLKIYYRSKSSLAPEWLQSWGEVQAQAEVIMTIFKFFGLLIINCFIVTAITRVQRTSVGKMRSQQDNSSRRRYRNSNILLLGSAALYCTTQFPSLVINCMRLADDQYGSIHFLPHARLFAAPIVNITFMLNYSVNFFLYLTVSKRFRAQFFEVFGKMFCKGKIILQKKGRSNSAISMKPTDFGTSLATIETTNGATHKQETAEESSISSTTS